MRRVRKVVTWVAPGVALAVLAACSGSAPAPPSPSSLPTSSLPTSSLPTSSPPTSSPPTSQSPSSSGSPVPSDSPSPSPSGSGTPSPGASPTTTAEALLRPGSSGPEVLAAQQRLGELGYWLGTPDGKYGDLTEQAVTALQKVAGIGRDGVLGPKTRAVLERGVRPSARSTTGRVVEVDLDHQVLLVVDGGQVRTVLNASSGSGEYYTRPNGTIGHAVTPRGNYAIFRSVDGWDRSPLGRLYRPRYFNGGIAVHGYPSVPTRPASHGCIRVSLPAMDMIWADDLLPRRTAVRVY